MLRVTLDWDLADRMRKAREVAGLSQGAMAARLSIARSSVVNYERRHTTPLPAIRKAWAEACGVSDAWLVTGSDDVAITGGYLQWGLAA